MRPGPGSRSSEIPWRLLVALALSAGALLVVTLYTSGLAPTGRYAIAGDGHYLYLSARSLAFDGDLDLSNQYLRFGDRWCLGCAPAADGTRFPPRELGPALLMVPGLWLHHLLGLPESVAPSFAVAPIAAILGLSFWLCTRALPEDPRPELPAALACLGFVLPYYALGRVAYPHASDALAVAALVVALRRRASPLWIGVAWGFACSMRLQNLLWFPWVWLTLRAHDDRPRRSMATATALAATSLLPFVVLALLHPGSERGPLRWGLDFFDLEHFFGDLGRVLFGVHGLVSFTPLAAMALVGIALAMRRRHAERNDALGIALSTALLCLLMATVRDVDGGDAFGARRLAGLTAPFALGLHWLFAHLRDQRRPRQIVVATAVAFTLANLLRTGAALEGTADLRSPRVSEAGSEAAAEAETRP